jgi:hypothetical protein
MALNLAPLGRWTLRPQAGLRRLLYVRRHELSRLVLLLQWPPCLNRSRSKTP